MISRHEAEQIAAEWARRETRRLGYQCTPTVDEFDIGYVVRSKPTAYLPAVPGDGGTRVIDKETGEVSSWPTLPSTVVQELYREDRATRPATTHTVDPAAELREVAEGRAIPGAAAHVTVDGRQYIARGARGAVQPRHHPLVRAYLDDLPPGHLVRGGDRHAELIVLSDVLHAQDRARADAGEPPLTQRAARDLLGRAHLEVFRAREPDDPAGGAADRPCDSCLNALVRLGALPWSMLAHTEEWRSDEQPVPDPGRFPAEVAFALVDGGWEPGFGDEWLATDMIADVCAVPGRRHPHVAFPAAQQALAAFPGLASGRRGPGEQVWISRFQINPLAVAHSADTLAEFGELIGVRLFPIGTEGGDSILAVDEAGRIFALDQAGDWFIGPDIDAALTTLLLGRAPTRVRADGTF
jgi:hypothetical protein